MMWDEFTSGAVGSDGRHIKIYGPDGFEGMRKAGLLAAQCLDFILSLIHI